MTYIEDLRPDDRVVEHYLCKKKLSGKTRSGKNYLTLTLVDKTGSIEAKVWELNNMIQNFEENDFIKIEADVNLYNNESQLKVYKIRKSAEGEYNPMDYIPATDKDIESVYERIKEYINSVTNEYLRKLLEDIIINDLEISKLIKTHSAAKNMHHSYMGGLLEHTFNVVEICEFLAPRYKYVNRDLLITAAILHDIGKVYELSEFPENDYTDRGQLIGHIVISVEIVNKAADKIEDFPETLLNLLKHCLLSHHGELEYGSPKKPKIIESFVLHCADNTDAKIRMYEEMTEKDNTKGPWLGYHRMLQRNMRKSEF